MYDEDEILETPAQPQPVQADPFDENVIDVPVEPSEGFEDSACGEGDLYMISGYFGTYQYMDMDQVIKQALMDAKI